MLRGLYTPRSGALLSLVRQIGEARYYRGYAEDVCVSRRCCEITGRGGESRKPRRIDRDLRSGRVDQAIEFPLPDEVGRAKLARLYSQGLQLSDELIASVVRNTEKVSAAFIKELMRRTAQFHLEQNGTDQIELRDIENALDEMLFSGGSLNLKLLGAEGAERPATACSN